MARRARLDMLPDRANRDTAPPQAFWDQNDKIQGMHKGPAIGPGPMDDTSTRVAIARGFVLVMFPFDAFGRCVFGRRVSLYRRSAATFDSRFETVDRPQCNFDALKRAAFERGDWFEKPCLPNRIKDFPPAQLRTLITQHQKPRPCSRTPNQAVSALEERLT